MFDQLTANDLVSLASRQPVLGDDEAVALVRRAQHGDRRAAEELVRGHLRIAVDEAIRVRGLGRPQRELLRSGVRALVEAVQAYDPLADGPFAVHLRRGVRQAVIRSVSIS